jgi:hypothetical protein
LLYRSCVNSCRDDIITKRSEVEKELDNEVKDVRTATDLLVMVVKSTGVNQTPGSAGYDWDPKLPRTVYVILKIYLALPLNEDQGERHR